MDFIVSIITEIKINQNSILVKTQSNNIQYGYVMLFTSGGTMYYPKIGEKVLLYRPLEGFDTAYSFAIIYSRLNTSNLLTGEMETGLNNNFIQFRNNEIMNIKTQTFNLDASVVNLNTGGANVLNQNAQMQVVIPTGTSAGTYNVIINNAGQTKVKA